MTAVMLETDPGLDSSRPGDGADLQPSDVFVGLYWQRYGEVAPGEEISRLEGEYVRSAGMPRPASYKPFADTVEFSGLLGDDLARLLALS